MGNLVGILQKLLPLDEELVARLKGADAIELNYTSRIKQKEEWVIQLRCEGQTEAITRVRARLNRKVPGMLKEEAEELKKFFEEKWPAAFHGEFVGYYFHEEHDEKCYGKLC